MLIAGCGGAGSTVSDGHYEYRVPEGFRRGEPGWTIIDAGEKTGVTLGGANGVLVAEAPRRHASASELAFALRYHGGKFRIVGPTKAERVARRPAVKVAIVPQEGGSDAGEIHYVLGEDVVVVIGCFWEDEREDEVRRGCAAVLGSLRLREE